MTDDVAEQGDGISNVHVLCNIMEIGYVMYTPAPSLLIDYKLAYYDFSKHTQSFIMSKDATYAVQQM